MRLSLRLALLLAAFLLLGPSARAQDDFWKEFEPAIRLADMDTMVKVTRKYRDQALFTFLRKVQEKLNAPAPSEKLETELRYLRDAWKRAFSDGLLSGYETLLGGKTPEQRSEWAQAVDHLRIKVFPKFNELQTRPDPEAVPGVLELFKAGVERMEKTGDLFWTSEGYYWYARLMDDARKSEVHGTADEAKALYQKCVDLRKQAGINDEIVANASGSIAAIDKENDTGMGAAAEGEAAGPRFAAGSTWIKIDLQPEAVPDPNAYLWPGHLSDDRIIDWIGFSAGPDGSMRKISWFPGEPAVHRDGATRLWFDMDGDGQPDGELKAGGKPQLVHVQRPVGNETQPYWFYVGFGGSQETIQGIGVNYGPSDKQAPMFFRSAFSRKGTLADPAQGVDIDATFFDENVSGEIGDEKVFNLSGTRWKDQNLPIPLYDSMILGKSKRPVPFSSLVVLDGKVYRMKFGNEKQEDVRLRLLEMEVGQGKVKVDGLKLPLESCLIEGQDDLKSAIFDLAADRKGIELPVGKYKLMAATFRTGKGSQIQKMAAIHGDMPLIDIRAGETTEVVLGKPFVFDFDYEDKGENIEVKGSSIVVRGGQGEIYFRYQGQMIQPEVQLRKTGSNAKRGKGEEMRICDGAAYNKAADAGEGGEIAWHPLDLVLPKPGGKGDFDVKLYQKAHKWFGSIDSEWKSK